MKTSSEDTDTHGDMGIRWVHMSYGTFFHVGPFTEYVIEPNVLQYKGDSININHKHDQVIN